MSERGLRFSPSARRAGEMFRGGAPRKFWCSIDSIAVDMGNAKESRRREGPNIPFQKQARMGGVGTLGIILFGILSLIRSWLVCRI